MHEICTAEAAAATTTEHAIKCKQFDIIYVWRHWRLRRKMLHEATNAQRKRKYVRLPCPRAACPYSPNTYIYTHTPYYPPLYIDIPMLIGLAPLKNLLTHQCRKFALQIMRARANNAENCPKKKNMQQIILQLPRKFAYEANRMFINAAQ